MWQSDRPSRNPLLSHTDADTVWDKSWFWLKIYGCVRVLFLEVGHSRTSLNSRTNSNLTQNVPERSLYLNAPESSTVENIHAPTSRIMMQLWWGKLNDCCSQMCPTDIFIDLQPFRYNLIGKLLDPSLPQFGRGTSWVNSPLMVSYQLAHMVYLIPLSHLARS